MMVSAPCRIDRDKSGRIVRVEPLRFIHARNVRPLNNAMLAKAQA